MYLVFEISGGALASHAAGAVHQDFLILELMDVCIHPFREGAEHAHGGYHRLRAACPELPCKRRLRHPLSERLINQGSVFH